MKKRVRAALCALSAAALLAADSWATWRLATARAAKTASAAVHGEAGSAQSPIARFRTEREQLRARQEAQLNDIIHGEDSDRETVAQAQRSLMTLMSCAQAEQTVEGILQGRGFEDALVSVSANSANVLVRREALTQRETAVILELVMRETGLTGGNVKIIPVK